MASRKAFTRLVTLALVFWGVEGLRAAEIRLRFEARCESTIVRLGDVADILGASPEETESLRAVELAPAPLAGTQRLLTMRELQDTLQTRGIAIFTHTFSGSPTCTVVRVGGGGVAAPGRISTAAVEQVAKSVAAVVEDHLRRSVRADVAWIVRAKLDPAQASTIQAGGRVLAVRGGAEPWYGPQRFELTLETLDASTGQPARLWVDADVDAPVAVVVAVRTLARGATVLAADVAVRHVPSSEARADRFQTLEDVVGLEVEQLIPADRPIERRQVRAPLLVRRGEVVTVYSRAAGVSIRTLGRASEDGARGDLVRVQPLDRELKPYYGRVCDRQTVEVFAAAMEVSPSRPSVLPVTAPAATAPGMAVARPDVAPLDAMSGGVASLAPEREAVAPPPMTLRWVADSSALAVSDRSEHPAR